MVGSSEYPYRAKRQLDFDAAIASDAVPMVPGIITSSLSGRGHLVPIGRRYAPARYADPVRIVPPYPGLPQYYMEAGRPPAPTQYQSSQPRNVRGFLPQVSSR